MQRISTRSTKVRYLRLASGSGFSAYGVRLGLRQMLEFCGSKHCFLGSMVSVLSICHSCVKSPNSFRGLRSNDKVQSAESPASLIAMEKVPELPLSVGDRQTLKNSDSDSLSFENFPTQTPPQYGTTKILWQKAPIQSTPCVRSRQGFSGTLMQFWNVLRPALQILVKICQILRTRKQKYLSLKRDTPSIGPG